MSKSKRVVAVVTENVRCAFAQPLANGEPGWHEVKLAIGLHGEVRSISCTCQEIYGEAVAGVYELARESGAADDSCFYYVAQMRYVLQRASVDTTADKHLKLPGTRVLRSVISDAYRLSLRRRAIRSDIAPPGPDKPNRFQDNREKILYKASGFNAVIAKLAKRHTLGHTLMCVSFTPNQRFLLLPFTDEEDTLAYRSTEPNSIWHMNPDAVKRWAANQRMYDRDCPICGDTNLGTLLRHTKSAKHIQRALDLVNLHCKALSSTGLKMLNSPDYRHVFLGENAK